MLPALLTIVVGFIALTWSADRFVLGASGTARHLGIPTLIIGLTIVGVGTSAPEMLVSAIAAWQGSSGIAVGNALGSNITNVGLILGATALIVPLQVRSRLLRREIPLLFAIMALAYLFLLDGQLERWEGLVLLAGMAALLTWMGIQGRTGEEPDPLGAEFESEIPADQSLGASLLWLAVGLVVLLASSRALVWAAVSIAEALGVSDLVIGLTIVALGTSLPEFAASLASARKGEHDIAIGNVIGSNMFNTLGVMGIAGTITPLSSDPATLYRDIPVMVGITLVFAVMAFSRYGHGRINRIEGALLLAAYIGYQALLYVCET